MRILLVDDIGTMLDEQYIQIYGHNLVGALPTGNTDRLRVRFFFYSSIAKQWRVQHMNGFSVYYSIGKFYFLRSIMNNELHLIFVIQTAKIFTSF